MIDSGIGSFETTTLDSILAGAKMRLRLRDTTSEDLLLKDVIVEGLKKSRVPSLFIRKETYIEIDNLVALLPCDFVKFDKVNPIRLIDNNNQGTWIIPQFIDNTFFSYDPDVSTFGPFVRYGTVSQVGKYLYFSSDISSLRAIISYLGTNVDEDGEIVIPEIMDSVLVAYACWKYGQVYPERMPSDIRSAWEMEYKLNKKAVKGIQNLPSSLETRLNSWRMNAII
jgi:hypothetical protein